MTLDVSIRIGGQAGQGMQSVGYVLGKIFSQQGYDEFICQDVESRIRGGHSYVQLRIKDKSVYAIKDRADLLIALDKGSIDADKEDLAQGGLMIFDGKRTGFKSDNPNHLSVPLEQIALEAGKNKVMANTVATGAALAVLGVDVNFLLDRLKEDFATKGQGVVDQNIVSARSGYTYMQKNFKRDFPVKIPPLPFPTAKMLISGSEAMALGAICSGLKFYSGYPMSPSTPIMEFVASNAKDFNIIVEPAEDEIAAINMVIGASFAGARAMTATSGGGFCLMTEALGLAGMTETPAVIVVAQRAGPSTGLPTRTEQADLGFIIHASHGEFPRAVLAPGNAEQAFYALGKAFNLADRYQTPIIVLGDQHLNDSYVTLKDLDPARIEIDRGSMITDMEPSSAKEFKRYAWADSGVSPRIFPGRTNAVLYADSDEHTEAGHITESADVRRKMMDKRMRKLQDIRLEMSMPEVYPSGEADIVLIGWGSTYGGMKEAVDMMNAEGVHSQVFHFSDIFPFPGGNLFPESGSDRQIFAVENNYSGQFADFFQSKTGISVHHRITKYDGRPFSPQEIVDQVKNRI